MADARDTQAVSKPAGMKKKIQTFLYYYKWPVVAAAVVGAVVIGQIYSNLTAKEQLLTGVMINSHIPLSGEESLTEFVDGFIADIQVDPEKNSIDLNANLTYYSQYETSPEDTYYSVQALSSQISGGILDFAVGNLEAMEALAYGDFFVDLSTILSEEELALYEPYLLYMDLAVLEKMQATDWSGEEAITVEFPDCKDPASMEKPIPVMIDVTGSEKLSSIYLDETQTLVFTVAGNAPHPERILQMIRFLIDPQKEGRVG